MPFAVSPCTFLVIFVCLCAPWAMAGALLIYGTEDIRFLATLSYACMMVGCIVYEVVCDHRAWGEEAPPLRERLRMDYKDGLDDFSEFVGLVLRYRWLCAFERIGVCATLGNHPGHI